MSTKYSSVITMISYEDGFAALEWLAKVFGFREHIRMVGTNGELTHREMEAGEGIITLATPLLITRVQRTTARTASKHANGPRCQI
jgi:uncharacterized glyoxalase superfamily protein PhnB